MPIERLTSADYARARAAPVDPDRAHPGLPDPGIGAHWNPVVAPREDAPPDPGELDTSYVCVVDRDGNAFSATPSPGTTGAPVVPGLLRIEERLATDLARPLGALGHRVGG